VETVGFIVINAKIKKIKTITNSGVKKIGAMAI